MAIHKSGIAALLVVGLLIPTNLSWGQGRGWRDFDDDNVQASAEPFPQNCFTCFCRIQFDSYSGRRGGWRKWRTDY